MPDWTQIVAVPATRPCRHGKENGELGWTSTLAWIFPDDSDGCFVCSQCDAVFSPAETEAINAVDANFQLATRYRENNHYQDGVVTVYRGEVQGWTNELRNPENWVPGCVTIDVEGNQWIAIGGNDYDGAAEWKPVWRVNT